MTCPAPAVRSCFFRVLVIALLVLLPSFLLASRSDGTDRANVSYTLATYPTNDPARVFAAFQPLADYIAAETGWSVRAVVTRNYEEMHLRLADGSLDFAFVSPAAYLRFADSFSYVATYAEREKTNGAVTPYYHSVILSLRNGPVKTLEDLRGRNFGFTDRESTSGHKVPRLMLRTAGVEPERFFGKVFYLGRHDAVIESLLAGSVDGGAVSDGTLARAVKLRGDLFRTLALSDPIPLDAVVAAPGVPQAHVLLLRDALLSVSADSAPMRAVREHLGWPAAGFVQLSDAFYDPLRRALELPTAERRNRE